LSADVFFVSVINALSYDGFRPSLSEMLIMLITY